MSNVAVVVPEWLKLSNGINYIINSITPKNPIFLFKFVIKVDTRALSKDSLDEFEKWGRDYLTSISAKKIDIKTSTVNGVNKQGEQTIGRTPTTISITMEYEELTDSIVAIIHSFAKTIPSQNDSIIIMSIDSSIKVKEGKEVLGEEEDLQDDIDEIIKNTSKPNKTFAESGTIATDDEYDELVDEIYEDCEEEVCKGLF